MIVAVVNMKPGTGKTSSVVWLAAALAEEGPVLAVDADPSESLLEWSDLTGGKFPFRVAGMPTKRLRRQVPALVKPGEDVVLDIPQIEDHETIARAAMLLADELLITCAPSGIEVNRTVPVLDRVAMVNKERAAEGRPSARACVLMNRVAARTVLARSTPGVLRGRGFEVLDAMIPRSETYIRSFAGVPSGRMLEPWRTVAACLRERAGTMLPGDAGRLAALRETAAVG